MIITNVKKKISLYIAIHMMILISKHVGIIPMKKKNGLNVTNSRIVSGALTIHPILNTGIGSLTT
jgi:hypothetical protein